MLVTFGATFFGVIASFLLWFGGQWWIKRQRDKKVLGNMIHEMQEEIQVNIALLTGLIKGVPKSLQEGMISYYLPYRMRLEVYQYAVSSGDVRLLEFSKQRLIRYTAVICEGFNKFIDNTEVLLAVFLMKSGGSKWARYRLEQLVESAKEDRDYLRDTLNKLQHSKLSKEDNMVEPKKIDLERIEAQLTRIERSLKWAILSSKYISVISLSIAAIAIGGSGLDIDLWGRILLVGGGIAVIFGSSLAIVFRRSKN